MTTISHTQNTNKTHIRNGYITLNTTVVIWWTKSELTLLIIYIV